MRYLLILLWIRVTQRLSTAIECTCQLISAQLQDSSPRAGSAQDSSLTGRGTLDASADQMLRMLYGIAIVRYA